MKPVSVSGRWRSTPPSIPSPARRTGTTSGGRLDPRAGGGAEGRLDVDRLDLDAAGGLVHEDAGQVVHRPPEAGPVGAGLAQPGEELGGERVVDDGDLHDVVTAGRGAGRSRA